MDLGVSGLISGFDWRSFIDQMVEVERAPQNQLRAEQTTLQNINSAIANLKNQLSALKTKVDVLKDPTLFSSRQANVSDSTIAKATASDGAFLGNYTITVSQFATASVLYGNSNVGARLSETSDVSGVVIGNASFYPPITSGFFTVDGKRVEVSSTDTLQQVFDKIYEATGGAVSASYDPDTDTITLSKSSGELVLGSAADTSNFLQSAKLYNNGTGTISSATALGGIKVDSTLSSANFAVPVEGTSGEFKINCVSITWSSTDRVIDIITRINNSSAGVIASYDQANDRFVLTNKTTGDVNIVAEDVSGNFLTAAGLTSGSLERGEDLLFSINGGATMRSRSNIITEESSGIRGLTVELLRTDSPTTFTVSVSTDLTKIKTAINDFITEYNKTQSLIDTQTAISTDSKGNVTAGVLSGQSEIDQIASSLRTYVNTQISGLSGTLNRLEILGITSSSQDNLLTISDTSKLDEALNFKLAEIQELFTNSDYGIGTKLSAYLENVGGEDGILAKRQTNIGKQVTSIDQQIEELERYVQDKRQMMIDSFIAMEQAQAKINQQLQFLLQRFGTNNNQ